jgi:hypothetical protein
VAAGGEEASRPDPVYPSEVDGWIAVVLVLTLAISLWSLGVMLGSPTQANLIGAGITAVVLTGTGLIMVPIRYVVASDHLVIRSGLWRRRIPLAGILRIYPSRSILSSPALSMDRLAVEYRPAPRSRATILISPVRREEFVRQVAAAADLVPQGDAWVRRERERKTKKRR